ncbi:hypothetical protein L1887_02102 [Cichorium endivia]|nr:hypothetical protein L1887_02102 [Cichorium endivia]
MKREIEKKRDREKLVVVVVKPGCQKLWFSHSNLEVGDPKTETVERMDCRMIKEVYRQSLVPLVPLADEEQSIDCRSLFPSMLPIFPFLCFRFNPHQTRQKSTKKSDA